METKYKLKWHERQSDGYFAYVDQVNEGPCEGWEKLPKEKLVIFYKKSVMKSNEYKSDWRAFVKDVLIKRALCDSITSYEIVMDGDNSLFERDNKGNIYSTKYGDVGNLLRGGKSTEGSSHSTEEEEPRKKSR